MSFPANSPTSLTETIPSYLYQQYADDENLQAFVRAYNAASQTYVDWFCNTELPVYTTLSGSLLDWVAEGLYGFIRPTLESPGTAAKGPLNTALVNELTVDGYEAGTSAVYYSTDDDTFKRILTWHLYKGDGKVFTIKWLKRRVLRFLIGVDGTAPDVSDTSQISVDINGSLVSITVYQDLNITSGIAESLQYAIQNGVLELPPQYLFSVTAIPLTNYLTTATGQAILTDTGSVLTPG